MIWTFEEAEAYLNDTAPPGKSTYGLGRINHILDLLGHPENEFPCITIAGTNGKGSTLAFLDSLLRAHDLKVGCHIKPHIKSVTERIRIDGIDSTPDEFASALWEVRVAVDNGWSRDDSPTYFELIFAAFLCAARSSEVDIALLEAGLGGRLDAVNSVDASLVILTSVDLDHTELLGDSLQSITKEKIAIVRENGILLCQENPPEVMETVGDFALSNNFRLIETGSGPGWQDNYELGIKGPCQPMNASLAVRALEMISECVLPDCFVNGVLESGIQKGLKGARLPGRWEVIQPDGEGPSWILDGAHNPSGLKSVLREFEGMVSGAGTIVFGMKKSKDVDKIIPGLIRASRRIIFVKVPYLESHDPENMAHLAREYLDNKDKFSQIQINWADSINEGLELASESTPCDSAILVTGSLYILGEAGEFIRGEN